MNICKHWKEVDGTYESREYCRAENTTVVCCSMKERCLNGQYEEYAMVSALAFIGNRDELRGYLNLTTYFNGRDTKVIDIARVKKCI
jgi:hypothetical protein